MPDIRDKMRNFVRDTAFLIKDGEQGEFELAPAEETLAEVIDEARALWEEWCRT